MSFLPVNEQDMKERNWEQCDFVYIIGDAYVDHPSFGPAIISRVLEAHGFRVGIIPQPDWKNEDSIRILGKPRLGFLVSGGNMDSMVNHYTVAKKHRGTDAYSPGGKMGLRPDRATIVYSNLIRKVYGRKVPVILGGIEASLRRLAHYDYWKDEVRRSILLDAQADLISYGMGEKTMVAIAEALDSGLEVKDLTFLRGTVYFTKEEEYAKGAIRLPSYEDLLKEKKNYAKSFALQHENTDAVLGKCLAEPYEEGFIIQNPPGEPLTQMEMDDVYDLPYERQAHPMYTSLGGIPALGDLRFSLVSNRGCFGSCSFCALTFHQGRYVQVRSHESLIKEAVWMTKQKDFKGNIYDVGGPTANFRHPSCKKQGEKGVCKNKECLFPSPCKNLEVDHKDYLLLLEKLRKLPKIKKVFIRSGLRYDYIMADPKREAFLKELCEYHVSGQLKVAPEHVNPKVLSYMGKPNRKVYEAFIQEYKKVNHLVGKEQYVVPYLISSHPGSTLKEAVELAEAVRDMGYMPEQVQDFYPTPSTLSTCMYYTGLDPRTMKEVYVPRNPHEKAMQRALIQYRNPKNYSLVKEALKLTHREDLIGFGKEALIPPRQIAGKKPDKKEEKPERKPAGKTGKNNLRKKGSKPFSSGRKGKR